MIALFVFAREGEAMKARIGRYEGGGRNFQ
jgi:hypothetical protein